MTTEEQIVAKVLENLADITIANGYSFDVANVFDWRDSPLTQGELPALIVRDVAHEIADTDELEHNLIIEVDLLDSGATAPVAIRAKKADVISAFSLIVNEAFVSGASFLRSEKEVEKDEFLTARETLNFSVSYFKDDLWEI